MLIFNKNRLYLSPFNAPRIEAKTVHTRARTQVTAAQSRRTSRLVRVAHQAATPALLIYRGSRSLHHGCPCTHFLANEIAEVLGAVLLCHGTQFFVSQLHF